MNTTLTNSTSLDFSVIAIFIISIHAAFVLLGLPLNVYIIYMLFPRRGVMDSPNVFSWNQSISEIIFVFVGPFQIQCSVNWNLCIFEGLHFFFAICLSSRCLFQCCVCLERYLAVVHPITFLKYKPLRYRVMCSITVWMCSLAVGIAHSCMFHNLHYPVFAVIYLLVLTVDSFCCVSILKKLRHPGPRDTESDVGEMNAAKKKAFQVVSVNLLAFLFQNIPISVAFGIQSILTEHAFGVAVVTSLLTSTVSGIFQQVFMLHRAGKLPLIQSAPLYTCCFSHGPG